MELNIIEHSSSLKITLQNIKQRLTLKPSIFSLDKNIRAWINRERWGFVREAFKKKKTKKVKFF